MHVNTIVGPDTVNEVICYAGNTAPRAVYYIIALAITEYLPVQLLL